MALILEPSFPKFTVLVRKHRYSPKTMEPTSIEDASHVLHRWMSMAIEKANQNIEDEEQHADVSMI